MCAVICPGAIAAAASPSSSAPDVLTLSEAAELLRVDADELEQLASRDEVPARRIGSSWRFNRDALLAWVNGDWGRIATIAPPDAGALRLPMVQSPAMAAVSLTPRELEQTTGAGTVVAQATAPQPAEPAFRQR